MRSRWTMLQKLLAVTVVAVGLAGTTAAPAFADGWRGHERAEHQWREHEWREHEWREHNAWRYRYGYGYAPSYPYYSGYYYAPPPAVYVPPPSVTFVVPFR